MTQIDNRLLNIIVESINRDNKDPRTIVERFIHAIKPYDLTEAQALETFPRVKTRLMTITRDVPAPGFDENVGWSYCC